MVICLERGADLHMAQVMPLPVTISYFSKIQIGLPFWYRLTRVQWRRQDSVTGGSEVWVYRGSRVRSPQSRLYCLCINVALCSTALLCDICRVIRRSFMTMKAHTYYIIFGRPPIGGKLPALPSWRRHCPVSPGQSAAKRVCVYIYNWPGRWAGVGLGRTLAVWSPSIVVAWPGCRGAWRESG